MHFILFHFILLFIFSSSLAQRWMSLSVCVPFIFCSLLDYGNAKHSLSFGCPALKMYERRSPDKIKQCDVAHTFPDFSSAVRIYQSSTFRFFCLSLSLCVQVCLHSVSIGPSITLSASSVLSFFPVLLACVCAHLCFRCAHIFHFSSCRVVLIRMQVFISFLYRFFNGIFLPSLASPNKIHNSIFSIYILIFISIFSGT